MPDKINHNISQNKNGNDLINSIPKPVRDKYLVSKTIKNRDEKMLNYFLSNLMAKMIRQRIKIIRLMRLIPCM